MKTAKQEALELIDRLPDSVSREAIITELQFKLLILKRDEEAERGENLIPHEEVERRFAKWLKSAGI